MNSTFAFNPKITAATLSTSIVFAVLSYFTLNSININLVHSQLYSYGLIYNAEWANHYEQYLTASLITITATLIFAALALTSLRIAVKRCSIPAKKSVAIFSVLTVFATISSLVLFVFSFGIINGELYSFGLKFSSAWFSTYQMYFAGYVSLQGTIIALSTAAFSIVSLNNKQPIKINIPKIVFPTFLAAGSLLIGFAYIYNFLAAFFVGFVLVFWGSIMVFISDERLIKKDVLDATSLTYFSQLNKISKQVDLQTVFTASASNSLKENVIFPKTHFKQIKNVELTFQEQEQVNIAPENELFNLMEQKLGKSFSGISFEKLKTVLPKLLVENLELTQNVNVEANGDQVRVTLEKPYDLTVYLKAEKQNLLLDAAGFPLSGAIAYALANSSGKAVIINQHLLAKDKKTVHIEYTLLGQRSAST